jgi:amidase
VPAFLFFGFSTIRQPNYARPFLWCHNAVMNRRKFVNATLATAVALQDTPASAQSAFELDEKTIDELSSMMEKGESTSRRITELYLARIEATNRKGPNLCAVIETDPDALTVADALDRERKQKGARGPMHGIPVLIKDNVGTADHTHTSAGSLALADWTPPEDAFLIQRLRAAGAVILGKANMSEWAFWRASRGVSGWSARGGQAKNPFALDRNPSGSSGGSGVAVSGNLCAVAVGSDTGGSITYPSSANGVVGIRPTLGLVSRTGVIPVSETQDTAGPMARTVRDAAILLGAMTGVDPKDKATGPSTGKSFTDYRQFLTPGGLRGARIVVAREYFGIHPSTDRVIEECLDLLKKEGAVLIDQAGHLGTAGYQREMMEVLSYDFKPNINDYLSQLPAKFPVRSLADLVAFNEKHKDREMPYFSQNLLEQSLARGPRTEKKYQEARAKCLRLGKTEGIDAALSTHKAVAIVAPSLTPAFLTDWVTGDGFSSACTIPACVSGYPHITVPAGFVRGLPIGLSFFGAAWTEPVLLKLAYGFETASRARRKPSFAPTVDLA